MIRTVHSTLGAIAVILALSVAAAPAQSAHPLSATLEAHGGIDLWQQQGGFTYTLVGFPLTDQVAQPNTATVDLQRRLHRIESEQFTIGYDGESAWSTPESVDIGLPVRFYTLGSFYFIGMPFVFADPGARVTPLGTQTFRGESFDTFSVGFGEGIGHTDEDEYVLFIDPETHRLRLINHTVTENPDVERVTWVYSEWQETDGLLIPASITFHPGWNPDEPGEGVPFTVEGADFQVEVPDLGLFNVN